MMIFLLFILLFATDIHGLNKNLINHWGHRGHRGKRKR